MWRGYFREGNASMQTKMGTSTLSSTPHLKQDLKVYQHHQNNTKQFETFYVGYLRTGKVRRTEMRCIQKLEIWSSAKWPIWLRLNRDEVHVRKAKAHD